MTHKFSPTNPLALTILTFSQSLVPLRLGMVKSFNEETKDNEFHPLYEYGSSKICRSTHVDMMRKVQVDLYVTGLHSRGSDAVEHYTKEELRDRFGLMCYAFKQPLYKVDKDLKVIENK